MRKTRTDTRKVGLARALSKLGYCSRSQAAELIRAGRVQVNGRVHRDPESPTTERDRIRVDRQPADTSARTYLMLNKPRGLVTTRSDEKGRPTIYECLDGAALPWLAPVGRLDRASEGLLLLTNDSEWAARVTDPAQHLDKTYQVQIDRVADGTLLQSLRTGVRSDLRADMRSNVRADVRSDLRGDVRSTLRADVRSELNPAPQERNMKARHGSAGKAGPNLSLPQSRRDGIQTETLRAKSARLLRHGEKNSWIEIILDEGRNRQIRRMLAALDVEVLRLIRVAIGPLQLGDLAKGSWRELTAAEKRAIDSALKS
jgi:23S rRNA pseudouridine2605 synthase